MPLIIREVAPPQSRLRCSICPLVLHPLPEAAQSPALQLKASASAATLPKPLRSRANRIGPVFPRCHLWYRTPVCRDSPPAPVSPRGSVKRLSRWIPFACSPRSEEHTSEL